jgi:hypothetical protein
VFVCTFDHTNPARAFRCLRYLWLRPHCEPPLGSRDRNFTRRHVHLRASSDRSRSFESRVALSALWLTDSGSPPCVSSRRTQLESTRGHTGSPRMSRINRKMIAITRRMWSQPPSIVVVTIPSSQSTTNKTTRNMIMLRFLHHRRCSSATCRKPVAKEILRPIGWRIVANRVRPACGSNRLWSNRSSEDLSAAPTGFPRGSPLCDLFGATGHRDTAIVGATTVRSDARSVSRVCRRSS